MSVVRATNNQSVVDTCHFSSKGVRDFELDTCQQIVGDLEVIQANITDLEGYGTITIVRPASETVEVRRDRSIVVPRIIGRVFIIGDALARLLARDHVVEDTQSVATNTMTVIVAELTNSVVLGTDAGVGVRTDRMDLQVVPEAISIRASNSIFDEAVVWLCDPESCRRLISVETRPTAFDHDNAIAVHVVLLLNRILDEDVVALCVVDNVVHDTHVVGAVQSISAVEALMCRTAVDVGLVDCTDLMEMHCIATDLEALANISHLDVGHASNQAIVTF